MITLSFLVLIIELSRNVIRFISRTFVDIFFRETLLDIQVDLAKKILDLKISVIDGKSSGIFIDRLTKDTKDIAQIFIEINKCLTEVLSNIGVLVAIFIVNKYVFIFFVISLTILFTFEQIRMKKWYEIDEKFRQMSEKNTGLITELIRGIKDIKVLNAGKTFLSRIEKEVKKTNNEKYEMQKVARIYSIIIGTLKDLTAFLFILFGVFLIHYGLLDIASFVILYMYQGRISNLLFYGVGIVEEFKKFNVSAKRVFEILESSEYEIETFGTKEIKDIKGEFEFKDVSFNYNKNKKATKNLSFKIEANSTVSFVGKSGAGKSTVLSLLTKLYTIDNGEILIDGIREFP